MLLHGSYATGRQKEGSDLDIAVVGRKALKSEDVTKILFDLEGTLGNDYTRELGAYAFKVYNDSRDLRNLEKLLVNKYQKHLNLKYA